LAIGTVWYFYFDGYFHFLPARYRHITAKGIRKPRNVQPYTWIDRRRKPLDLPTSLEILPLGFFQELPAWAESFFVSEVINLEFVVSHQLHPWLDPQVWQT
jgi:hypothetical protein